MIGRRRILKAATGLVAFGLLPGALRAAAPNAPIAGPDALAALLAGTDLVYLTTLRRDGSESRCQAEVWFVADSTDIFVVTAAGAWRARAVAAGLPQTRIWVGDLGVWTRTEGRNRDLPQVDASAEIVTAPAEHERVLALFGSKYPVSWVLWGPRFRKGLADGSRVMLRYRPVVA